MMPGAHIEWGPLANESKTEDGVSPAKFLNYLSCKWYKLSNSGTYFVNEIELYIVNYLLFAPTRFASAGNGHLKREPAVAFTCSILEIQSSRITLNKLAKLTQCLYCATLPITELGYSKDSSTFLAMIRSERPHILLTIDTMTFVAPSNQIHLHAL